MKNTVVSCHKPVARSRRRWEEKISCCVRTFAGFPAPPLPPPPSLKAETRRTATRQSETTNGHLMYRAHYSSKNLLIPGVSLRFPFTPPPQFSPLAPPLQYSKCRFKVWPGVETSPDTPLWRAARPAAVRAGGGSETLRR